MVDFILASVEVINVECHLKYGLALLKSTQLFGGHIVKYNRNQKSIGNTLYALQNKIEQIFRRCSNQGNNV